jgi:hypothetical protein
MIYSRIFVALFTAVLLVPALNISVSGQCGVYLKRKSTQIFPDAYISLDKAEDMTGDGVADLIASRGVVPQNQFRRDRIYIIASDGTGLFGSPIAIDAPAGSFFSDTYTIGYVNNDLLKDFVVLVSTGSSAVIRSYLNNGNGTFTPSGDSLNSGAPSNPLVDFNGDGINDLQIVSSGFRYRPGVGNGTFGTEVNVGGSNFPRVGDFNADGKPDAISTSVMFLNQGSGNFTMVDVSAVFPPFTTIYGVRDFNGDGKSDVLTGGSVFFRNDTGFTGVALPRVISGTGFLVGNFNGNSAPDIIFEDIDRNRKEVYTNDGSGNFSYQLFNGAFSKELLARRVIGDFDNDGRDDLVRSSSKQGNATPIFQDVSSFTFLKNVCDRVGQPRIVDFDNSGTTDLSFWNPSTGAWAFRTNFDSVVRSETVNWGLGSLGDIPTPGDFDGDGITDRAVFRNSTGYWWILWSSNGSWAGAPFGTTGDIPVAADYDGDTITDLAVFRPSDGIWHVWFMGTQQYMGFPFGQNGDKPVPADYDGDLKTDFAVFRPSNGVWYYLRSSDLSYASVLWGLGTDKPMPADFDGDGKADLSVYRSSDGVIYILRSYNLGFGAFAWGSPGDLLSVMDTDGDFVADFGIYRPSNNQWWMTGNPFSPIIFGEPGIIATSSIRRIE